VLCQLLGYCTNLIGKLSVSDTHGAGARGKVARQPGTCKLWHACDDACVVRAYDLKPFPMEEIKVAAIFEANRD
jgi:hypothetical protein